MPGRRVIASTSCLLVTAGVVYGLAETSRTRAAREIVRLTEARTRVVWCQQVAGNRRDTMGSQLVLMGLDSTDRNGPRPLLDRQGNYWKPMIAPRGDRVVFTDYPGATIYVVNWSGSSLRELCKGYALTVRMDPATGQEWVYAVAAEGRNGYAGKPVIRCLLDNPFRQEKVWEATPIHFDNLRVSTDGTRAGALFPWPVAGVADLRAGTWRKLGRGCWPDLSPDNRYLLWVFDGAHRNLVFHSADGSASWTVNINAAPGVEGHEVDCPRWSNRTRVMAMSGPRKRDGRNPGTGREEEIYLGRFDRALTRVERWARVTRNERPDFFPDVWVEPTAGVEGALAPVQTRAAGEKLVVQARLVETSVAPTLQAIAPYRQALAVYAYEVENVATGKYRHARLLVAHWALVDGKPRPIPRVRGQSYSLAVEPLDGLRELEGERIIMDMRGDNLPLYYEIDR